MANSRPNFFLLGAHKAATTSLFDEITAHPDVFSSPVKETRFFSDDDEFEKGYDYYENTFFGGAENYSLRGEATPRYLGMPRIVPSRIKSYLAGSPVRFLVILRDPVQRAWSHYRYRIRGISEEETFAKALELEESRLPRDPNAGYYRAGCYGSQLAEWFLAFSPSLFHILLMEDYLQNREHCLEEIFRFLGVEGKSIPPRPQPRNVGGVPRNRGLAKFLDGRTSLLSPLTKRVLPPSFRRRIAQRLREWNTRPVEVPSRIPPDTEVELRARFLEEILLTEELTGLDLSRWKANV